MAQVFVIGAGMVDAPPAPAFETTALTGPQLGAIDKALADAGGNTAAVAREIITGSQPATKE